MKPIAYGPECCLDTAVAALEKIFQKKVDPPMGRVFNPVVTATTNQTERRQELGFFEEFITADGRPKGLGQKLHQTNPHPGRPYGAAGRRVVVLTQDFTLQRGVNAVTYKASKARPVRVTTMLHPLQGKTSNP